MTADQHASEESLLAIAEAVRAACLQAARDGYEMAGVGGLCEEGRVEMVFDSIQSLDVKAVIRQLPNDTGPGQSDSA